VNIHTVLRALAQLRGEGLLEMRRGRGVTLIGNKRQAKLRQLARALVDDAESGAGLINDLIALARPAP